VAVPAGGSGSTTFVVNTAPGTPLGQYSFAVAASDGVANSSSKAALNVDDYSVSISPSTQTVLQSLSASYSVSVTSADNYIGPFTATCTGIPAPAVCSVSGQGTAWVANTQTNNLATGNYTFTVALSNGVATRSASAQLNIGDFSASLSSNSLSVVVGQSGNITIDVTGQYGFRDAVTLTCSGAPTGTNCAISPSPVTPSSAGTPATMTVTVTTKPSASDSQSDGRNLGLSAIVVVTFVALGFVGTLSRTPARNRGQFRCLMLMFLVALELSCGGGGSTGSGGGGGGGGGGVGDGGGGGGGGSVVFTVTVQASSDNVTKNVGTVQVTVP
jgi:hypothetical protein